MMKKEWVKRENMYYKPFYKQKAKVLLLVIFLFAIAFFVYEIVVINQLPMSSPIKTTYSYNYNNNFNNNREPRNRKASNSPTQLKTDDNQNEKSLEIIRGIRLFDYHAYKPDSKNMFHCLSDSKAIPYSRVNDDFCDCADGSDEPSTNACANGKFYCRYQKRHITGRGRDFYIPSSRVNDRVCDCCDGSDETDSNVNCRNRCL
ncbi:hypothetical protein ACFFRR_007150 [Megaselia abdita]